MFTFSKRKQSPVKIGLSKELHFAEREKDVPKDKSENLTI